MLGHLLICLAAKNFIGHSTAPFVELINNAGFQEEGDFNQDGSVDLLDVGPFVEALSCA